MKRFIAILSAAAIFFAGFTGCTIKIDKSQFQTKEKDSSSSNVSSSPGKKKDVGSDSDIVSSSVGDDKSDESDTVSDSSPIDTSQYQAMYVTGDEDVPVFKNENGTEEFASLHSGELVYRIGRGVTDNANYSFVYSEKLKDSFGYIDGYFLTPYSNEVTKGETYYVTQNDTPAYNDDNRSVELFRLNRNTAVTVMSKRVTDVWLVRNQGNDVYGYIDKNMLSENRVEEKNDSSSVSDGRLIGAGDAPESGYEVYTVTVEAGFLALRSEEAFDDSNILGEMYNGEEVYVLENTGTYFYVYSPKLGFYGYANGKNLKQ